MREELKKIVKAAREVRELTPGNRRYETGGDWRVQDSGLLSGDQVAEEGDNRYSYNSIFEGLYPEEFRDLKEYLESRLESKKGKIILIEMGGRASKLSQEFSPGFLERSLGVVLYDNRRGEQRAQDTARHHEVLAEDGFSFKGKRAIRDWLKGRKPDLFFEKMDGATASEKFPSEPGFLGAVFNDWYSSLSEKDVSIMLTETPPLDFPSLTETIKRLEALKDKLKDKGVTIKYKLQDYDHRTRLYIILEKTEGAPKNLL